MPSLAIARRRPHARGATASPDTAYLMARRAAYEAVIAKDWPRAEGALAALSADSRFTAQDWVALATTCVHLQRQAPCEAAARRALALDPDNVRAAHLLTLVLTEQGRWTEALPVFEHHNALPDSEARKHYHFLLNHGTTLHELGRYAEAAVVFLDAMVLNMADSTVHMKLGLAFKEQRLYVESGECFATAHALQPDRFSAQLMAVHMRQHACRWAGFEADCAAVIETMRGFELKDRPQGEGGVFSLAAFEHPPLLFKAAVRQVALARMEGVTPKARRPLPAPGERKLRIGYVSCDFHNHATALLLVQVLEQRDSARFEVTLYSHSPTDHTALEHRIRSACEHFVDLRGAGEAAMADRIEADGIDILVDLKGHTQDNRFGVFAHRAAALQVAFLGFPGTTGADYIDYMIGDRWVMPIEHADRYTEQIAQMPGSYQCNDSTRPLPEPATRAQCGLPEDALVLGCFNQSYKITPESWGAWMRILDAVPNALLWMLEDNPQATANLRHEARQRGVDPDRIVFAPKIPFERHVARLPVADLMLDNWPCNAHTTASDALWMGVPIVTVMGEIFASRVCASLLHAVGLSELVCHSAAEYEALVIALLRDPQRLQALRRHLLEGRAGFSLFDGTTFARDLEALYLRMAERARAGLPAEHLPAA